MGFAFDYPKDKGTVNGEGVFCTWGNYSAPIVGIQGISASWTQGGVQQGAQIQILLNASGVWSAQATGNIPNNTTVTLTVTAMNQPDPQQPPVPVPEVITFTFAGPAPQTLLPATAGS